MAYQAALISVSKTLSQTPALYMYTARPWGIGASASRGLSVYSSAFAGIHCTYPRIDGQAELTWAAGYIPGWFTRS